MARDPDTPRPDHEETELEEQFSSWTAQAPPAGRWGAAAPRSAEETGEVETRWAQARRRRWLRQTAMVLLVSITALGLWSARGDLSYFASSRDAADLGHQADLVSARLEAGQDASALPPLPENAFVRLSGLVMTSESESGRFRYFFCPLRQIVVRTERELPEQPRSDRAHIEVSSDYAPLLMARLAFPHQLTTFFEAEGRLLRLRHAPAWARRVVGFYAPLIDGDPFDAYLLLDGETPGDFLAYALGLLLALLLTAGAVYSWLRARREEAAWSDRLAA